MSSAWGQPHDGGELVRTPKNASHHVARISARGTDNRPSAHVPASGRTQPGIEKPQPGCTHKQPGWGGKKQVVWDDLHHISMTRDCDRYSPLGLLLDHDIRT